MSLDQNLGQGVQKAAKWLIRCFYAWEAAQFVQFVLGAVSSAFGLVFVLIFEHLYQGIWLVGPFGDHVYVRIVFLTSVVVSVILAVLHAVLRPGSRWHFLTLRTVLGFLFSWLLMEILLWDPQVPRATAPVLNTVWIVSGNTESPDERQQVAALRKEIAGYLNHIPRDKTRFEGITPPSERGISEDMLAAVRDNKRADVLLWVDLGASDARIMTGTQIMNGRIMSEMPAGFDMAE